MALSKEVTKALKGTGYLPDLNGDSPASGACSASSSTHETAEANGTISDEPQPGPSGVQTKPNEMVKKDDYAAELYKKTMRELQIDTCEFSMSGSSSHAFASAFTKAGMPSANIIFRVAQELSSLTTSLPMDFSSAIFLRTDDDKPTLMKVLITG